jgi:colanic acid/amylovoran biosynthesis glycosyltransferase
MLRNLHVHAKENNATHLGKGEMRPLRVAYLLLHFPRFTETFVAAEIDAIRAHSIDVRIISLLSPRSGIVQRLSQQLLQYTWYAPSVLNPVLWRAQVHFLLKSRRLYLHLLRTLLSQPYPKQPLRLFLKRLVVFLKAVAVAHYLEGSGIELLHSHFAWLSGAATWICARLLGVPFTVTVHAYDIFSSRNELLPLISREAARVIAISEFNRAHIAALGTCAADLISVIHCGVNLATLPDSPDKQTKRPAGGPFKILSVGNLVAKKGHSNLVAACRLLKINGLDFCCTIIGGGPDETFLRRQIETHGLQLQVQLLGRRSLSEIIDAYHQHDLFVLACTVAPDGAKDGIPVVLMEAGKEGLPLISTAISGIPELVRHAHTGWLVPTDDPTALADAIAGLAADPALRVRLGRNARALVESEFNIDRSTLQLAALFRETCPKSTEDISPPPTFSIPVIPDGTWAV